MNGKQLGIGIIYGISTNTISVLLFGMIFGLLLRLTSIPEDSLTWVFRILSFIIMLTGGLVAGMLAKNNGYLVGIITAITFSLLILSIQYLGFDQWFSMEQWITHGGFLVASMIGGMLGSSLSRSST